MLCEMCGKDVEVTVRARVEGSVLSVCSDCARFGTVLDPPPAPTALPPAGGSRLAAHAGTRPPPRTHRLEERDLYTDIGELELAPDWAKRVRVAREALGWKPEDLAKKLNEKKSVVLKIEAGGFHPPDALVRKIEHLLKIRLRADLASQAEE